MELNAHEVELVQKIAKENNFNDFEIITTAGSSKGNNFLGIIKAVTIKSKEKSLHLILKVGPSNETSRQRQRTDKLYQTEAFVYETLFEEYKQFQEEYAVPTPFNFFAKLYETNVEEGKEILVFENLKEDGYVLFDKNTTMTSEHIEIVLREYAKFHATSLAFKAKKPNEFQKLTSHFEEIFDLEKYPGMDEFIENTLSNAYKVTGDDEKVVENLKKYQKNLKGILKYDPNSKYNVVITHGDSWCNNFLFKYEGSQTKTPSSVKILDWQICKFSSPGFDLSYFLLANSSEDILENYLKYLHFYHSILSKTIAAFGLDAEEIFSFSLLEDHFKRYVKNAFWTCLIILRMTLCEGEEAPDLSNDSDADVNSFITSDVSNMDKYYNRITYLVRFMHKNDFL